MKRFSLLIGIIDAYVSPVAPPTIGPEGMKAMRSTVRGCLRTSGPRSRPGTARQASAHLTLA